MRWRTAIVVGLALVLFAALGYAQKKNKKASVPAVFGVSRYVYVQAVDGDMFNPRLLPEDRDAISNVNDALHAWGRYILTPSPDGSELVFIVRKGRLGSGRVGGTVGTPGAPGSGPNPGNPGNPRQPAPGVQVGGDVGPADDFLEVRLRDHDGNLSGPIWERSMTDGLDAPRVPLVQILRDAVERDYPQK